MQKLNQAGEPMWAGLKFLMLSLQWFDFWICLLQKQLMWGT